MALPTTNNRTGRILAVTAGLAATGAVVGAFCAAVAVTVIIGIEAKRSFFFSPDLFKLLSVVALIGAVTGFVAAPALAWGLLRRVSLGRAILVTSIGTMLGLVLGELLFPFDFFLYVVPGAVLGGWLGFLLAGVALHLHSRRA